MIETFGPAEVGMPHIKPMGQGLFEIRVKACEGIGRALYCAVKGKVVIILNGFIKKTQKTPANEIALASQIISNQGLSPVIIYIKETGERKRMKEKYKTSIQNVTRMKSIYGDSNIKLTSK